VIAAGDRTTSEDDIVKHPFIWIGAAIMAVSETATLLRIEPFWSWNTPIAWTGFILCADGIVFRARGNSWIRSTPREFAALALLSIPLWVVFEGFNLVLRNWYYTGLPENVALRYVGYAWSFATIWPAIFEGAELIGVARGTDGPIGVGGGGSLPPSPTGPSVVSVLLGSLMLAVPFFVSADVARYLAAPVWLGFIFLLDPINARLGAESLWRDARAGRYDRIVNLMASGVLCGVLWEFWNYWAGAKWHYSVPILEQWKVFEMPVPGYLGFPAFALECFTMYVFVRAIFTRRIASRARPFADSVDPAGALGLRPIAR
jgi:hypothetical protein